MRVIEKPLVPIRKQIAEAIEAVRAQGSEVDYVELTAAEWSRLYREGDKVYACAPAQGQWGTLESFRDASEAQVRVNHEGGTTLVTVRRIS